MIAFDVTTLDTSELPTVPNVQGVAYMKLSPQLQAAMQICAKRHRIIGFDFEPHGEGNMLGLILGRKEQ